VPVYESADHILAEEKEIPDYCLNEEDFNLVRDYYHYLGDDKIILVNYDATPRVLIKIKDSFSRPNDYYKTEKNSIPISKPDLILSNIINHFSLIPEKFRGFERVEKGKFIVHFERIRFNPQKKNLEEFLEKVKEVSLINKKEKKIYELQLELFKAGLKGQDLFSKDFNSIKIKYIPNHYYYPIVLSEPKHKIDYLNHIITEESEIKFIKELDDYLAERNNLFDKKLIGGFFQN
jgi:hypothetical protein